MLPEIDWSRAWYDAVRPAFTRLKIDVDIDSGDWIAAFNACAGELGLHNASGQPLRFVPQEALPEGQAYEQFIGATGGVPTRANLHDFFNALVWLTFPRIKRQLNALQSAQIALAGVGASRGSSRDAATIFDENAALLVVRDSAAGRALVAALRGHRWDEAFCQRREAFGSDAELWLFGHALMEKLVAPRKAICAHTRVVTVGDAYFALSPHARRAWIDLHVSAALTSLAPEFEPLTTAGFTPLPVLGVPGWWPQQDAAFYADASVFRPKRAG